MARKPGFLQKLFAYTARAAAEPIQDATQNVIEAAKAKGRSALDITIFVLVGLVGYVFVFLGLALLLEAHLGLAPALLLIGGVHVAVGVIGVIALVKRKGKVDPQPVGEPAQPTLMPETLPPSA